VLEARGNRWPTIPSRNGTELRWHVVTVYLPPDKVMPEGRLPEPLAELGDAVRWKCGPLQATRAPSWRRACVRVSRRARAAPQPGWPDDPRQAVRSALRQAKQLLETGEVLHADCAANHQEPADEPPD
jgi:hypothetical protein